MKRSEGRRTPEIDLAYTFLRNQKLVPVVVRWRNRPLHEDMILPVCDRVLLGGWLRRKGREDEDVHLKVANTTHIVSVEGDGHASSEAMIFAPATGGKIDLTRIGVSLKVVRCNRLRF